MGINIIFLCHMLHKFVNICRLEYLTCLTIMYLMLVIPVYSYCIPLFKLVIIQFKY